jgi:hypothetical protein
VHVEGAFLSADSKPSASSESPTGQALSIIYTPSGAFDLEESGLEGDDFAEFDQPVAVPKRKYPAQPRRNALTS